MSNEHQHERNRVSAERASRDEHAEPRGGGAPAPGPDGVEVFSEKRIVWMGAAIHAPEATYVPVAMADGRMGYFVASPDNERQEFLYLDPGSEGRPAVFVHHGPDNDPHQDRPLHRYTVLDKDAGEPYFRLRLQLNRSAMSTTEQVATALRGVAEHLGEGDPEGRRLIADSTGNTVGLWSMLLPEELDGRWRREALQAIADGNHGRLHQVEVEGLDLGAVYDDHQLQNPDAVREAARRRLEAEDSQPRIP